MKMSPTRQAMRCSTHQQGISLVEVAIVTAIVVLVAIIGIPAVGAFVIEHKVPKVAEAVQRFAVRTQVNAQDGGDAPYLGLDTGVLARALRENTVFDVRGTGAGASVAHGLGQGGVLTLAPGRSQAGGAGTAFTLTLTRVNHAACPALASILQGTAGMVRLVATGGGGIVLKNAWATPQQRYSAARTAQACTHGDANDFVFEYR
ncbi:MAG: prepilin-type cleavage/methylation domain-containing protein [Burkholderiaceae bacterium]|nr:prepilin-type cleavage/methylation domain-containing protein [Burkholderiaceae bacterium]